MKKTLQSQSGFSLIELMVVVAIIGILASVAIPNFQRFQQKSKQSEAKSHMGGIYMAEKAFHSEWDMYTGDFRDIGFSPEGAMRYTVGFGAVGTVPAAPFNPSILGCAASTAFNSGVACAVPRANTGAAPAFAAIGALGTCAAAANPAGNGVGATFNASALGNIGGTQTDWWVMNDRKVLCNSRSGVQ